MSNSYIPAIVTSVLRLLGSAFGAILVHFIGKKRLLVQCCVVMAASIALLAANAHFKEELLALLPGEAAWATTVESVIPVGAITVYMVAFGLGTGTIPFILLGELVPTKVRKPKY